ncbi:MAG: hypothetical protein ACYDA4_15130 [Ignavibacteriaceae bacterium]
MNIWLIFWLIVSALSILSFAFVSFKVIINGYSNIKELFESLAKKK